MIQDLISATAALTALAGALIALLRTARSPRDAQIAKARFDLKERLAGSPAGRALELEIQLETIDGIRLRRPLLWFLGRLGRIFWSLGVLILVALTVSTFLDDDRDVTLSSAMYFLVAILYACYLMTAFFWVRTWRQLKTDEIDIALRSQIRRLDGEIVRTISRDEPE